MARPPIIFIHGAFSRGDHFAPWARYFSQAGFECHAPSLLGHDPSDPGALASLTLSDYLAALRAEVARLGAAPILVGHSMGGLLAQQLAASGPCRALVCIASAPPWCLIPPLRSVRFLLPAFPAILFGWTIPHSEWALRNLALTKLPESEQRELVRTLGAESGRAFRAMWFGLARLPGPRFTGPVLCLSGRDDRIVADRTSRALARSYDARHVTFEQSGHWLIAASAQGDVAGTVMRWLEKNQLTA